MGSVDSFFLSFFAMVWCVGGSFPDTNLDCTDARLFGSGRFLRALMWLLSSPEQQDRKGYFAALKNDFAEEILHDAHVVVFLAMRNQER